MTSWLLGSALLVNHETAFDVIVDHYRMFGSEPTAEPHTFASVSLDGDRGAKFGPASARFSNFLELIQGLSAVAARGLAIVVNHGMSDANGQPLGLVLGLTRTPSPWRVDEYVLGVLAGFVDAEPAEGDFAKLEKSSTIGATHTTLPPGSLKQLNDALKILRGKKLQRVEIRACNLGGNPKVMKLLAKVLGITESISAPDVHMFYGRVPAHITPTNTAGIQRFLHIHRTARVFTDGSSQKPGSAVLEVTGTGPQRVIWFNASTADVSWFVDQNIMWGHYAPPPGSARLIPPFTVAGMDVNGSFAMPLESGYRAHIAKFTP